MGNASSARSRPPWRTPLSRARILINGSPPKTFVTRERNSAEMIYGSPTTIRSLSLLTDNPEKDDNGENDVVQEPIKRVHAGLTAVMLAEKRSARYSAIPSRNNRLEAAYRRRLYRRANVQELRVESLSPWPPLSLSSFLPFFLPFRISPI